MRYLRAIPQEIGGFLATPGHFGRSSFIAWHLRRDYLLFIHHAYACRWFESSECQARPNENNVLRQRSQRQGLTSYKELNTSTSTERKHEGLIRWFVRTLPENFYRHLTQRTRTGEQVRNRGTLTGREADRHVRCRRENPRKSLFSVADVGGDGAPHTRQHSELVDGGRSGFSFTLTRSARCRRFARLPPRWLRISNSVASLFLFAFWAFF